MSSPRANNVNNNNKGKNKKKNNTAILNSPDKANNQQSATSSPQKSASQNYMSSVSFQGSLSVGPTALVMQPSETNENQQATIEPNNQLKIQPQQAIPQVEGNALNQDANLQAQHDKPATPVAESKVVLTPFDNNILEKEQMLKDLEQHRDQLVGENIVLNQKITQVQAELDKRTTEANVVINELRQTVLGKEQSLKQLEQQNQQHTELVNKSTALTNEVANLKAELKNQVALTNEANTKASQLEAQIASLKQEKLDLTNKQNELNQKLKKANESLEKLKENVNSANVSPEEAKKTALAIQTEQLRGLETQLQQKNGELESLQAQLKVRDIKITEVQQKLIDAYNNIDSKIAKIGQLQQALDESNSNAEEKHQLNFDKDKTVEFQIATLSRALEQLKTKMSNNHAIIKAVEKISEEARQLNYSVDSQDKQSIATSLVLSNQVLECLIKYNNGNLAQPMQDLANAVKALHDHANTYAIGKPSAWQKFVGALLALASAVVLTLGLAGTIFTAGASFVAGVTLASSGFAGGSALFANGRRTKMSAATTELAEDCLEVYPALKNYANFTS